MEHKDKIYEKDEKDKKAGYYHDKVALIFEDNHEIYPAYETSCFHYKCFEHVSLEYLQRNSGKVTIVYKGNEQGNKRILTDFIIFDYKIEDDMAKFIMRRKEYNDILDENITDIQKSIVKLYKLYLELKDSK